MFFSGGFRIGKIGGITIAIDYSWFIIFGLIVFLLGTQLQRLEPGLPTGSYWIAAVATSFLFFSSVVAHELSHAFVARRNGIPVNLITLFIFGGVAQMEDEPGTPWSEFIMAAAGPAMSFLLGGLFLVIFLAVSQVPLVGASLGFLSGVNILLALFNLLPGFPMDGGRIFRAILWSFMKDLRRATRVASLTGQAFGWFFILIGVGSLVYPPLRQYGSIWMALIGWFLITAARNSYQQVVMRDTLSHVPVTDIMNREVERVPADISVEHLVTEYFLRESASALPVEENGELIGMVSVEDVRAVPRERWAFTLVGDITKPLAEEQVLHPDADAWDAANRMAQTNRDRVLVTEGGHVEGVVTRGAILRWLQTHTGYAAGTA